MLFLKNSYPTSLNYSQKMPMLFFLQQHQEFILTLLKKIFKIYFPNVLLVEGRGGSAIDIFYPSGEL